MLKNLVIKKNNLISYAIALFISLASLISGAMPFGIAFIGALVDKKVPILISFIIMIITTALGLGFPSTIRFVIAVIIFAFLKSRYKDKEQEEPMLKVSIKFLISQIIALVLMIIFKQFAIELVPMLLFEIIIATAFMVIFSKGLNAVLNIPKVESLNDNEQISSAILLMLVPAFLAIYTFMGISVFSIVSIVLLALLCWKNSIKLSLLYSLCFGILFVGVTGEVNLFIVLYLLFGTIMSLLSRVGKKGMVIGACFALVYLLFFAPSKDKIYSQFDMNPRLMEDYQNFVASQQEKGLISGDGLIGDIIDFDSEIENALNTPAVIMLRQMLIVFVLLMLVPNSCIRKYEKVTRKIDYSYEEAFMRMFRLHNQLLLNPGPPEEKKEAPKPEDKKGNEEKQDSKNDSNDDKTKSNNDSNKGKSNKKNKNKKKKRKIVRFSVFQW